MQRMQYHHLSGRKPTMHSSLYNDSDKETQSCPLSFVTLSLKLSKQVDKATAGHMHLDEISPTEEFQSPLSRKSIPTEPSGHCPLPEVTTILTSSILGKFCLFQTSDRCICEIWLCYPCLVCPLPVLRNSVVLLYYRVFSHCTVGRYLSARQVGAATHSAVMDILCLCALHCHASPWTVSIQQAVCSLR